MKRGFQGLSVAKESHKVTILCNVTKSDLIIAMTHNDMHTYIVVIINKTYPISIEWQGTFKFLRVGKVQLRLYKETSFFLY